MCKRRVLEVIYEMPCMAPHPLWVMDFKLIATIAKYFPGYSKTESPSSKLQQLWPEIMMHNKLNFS